VKQFHSSKCISRFFSTGALTVLVLGSLSAPPPAVGWGDRSVERIVSESLSRLPAEVTDFLSKTDRYFSAGLNVSAGRKELYLGFSRPDNTGFASAALARQLNILSVLYEEGETPYLSYRLGVFSSAVIDCSFPLVLVPADEASIRKNFSRDVDESIGSFTSRPRTPEPIADPDGYFRRMIERSSGWLQPVISQYRVGRGYDTVARLAAAESFQAAVTSLADVLYTISRAERDAPVTDQERYNYYRDACRFYLDRGERKRAVEAYRKLEQSIRDHRLRPVESLSEGVERYRFILRLVELEKRVFSGRTAEGRVLGARRM